MNGATRPPTPDPGTDPGRSLGAFLDGSGRLVGRAAEVAGRTSEQLDRLIAAEVADRAVADSPRPGLLIRAGRRLFGRGLPTPARPARPTPTPSADLAPMPTWMRWIAAWLDRTVGALPLLAPLAVSGWYTAHVGTDALGLPPALAVALTVALEGGVWKLGRLYEKTLVAGDSTIALRLGLFAYVAAIGGLIYWHATTAAATLADADWRPAAVVSSMSLAGFYIWSRQARWTRRAELRAAGRVDTQLVRFSVWSWLVAPLETAAALRYAVKHRIDRPIEAVEAYRADRDRRRTDRRQGRADRRTDRQAAAATPDQPTPPKPTRHVRRAADPTPTRSIDSRPGTGPTPTTNPVPTRSETTRKPKRKPTGRPVLGSADDRPVLDALRELYPTGSVSINAVEAVVKKLSPTGTCSRSKAIRLKNLYAAERAEQTA